MSSAAAGGSGVRWVGGRVVDPVTEYAPWEPAPPRSAPPEVLKGYRIEPHAKSRYWQVFDPAGELICLAVYKRGAREVMRRLAA